MLKITGTLAAVFLAGAVWAQSAAQDIQGVISDQFQAFQADDFGTAFTFASPNIKGIFGTAERFGEMVKRGYPMVHRPADVDFTTLSERGGRQYQNVVITDQSGVLHVLEYEMIETGSGWQINGVQIKKADALGA